MRAAIGLVLLALGACKDDSSGPSAGAGASPAGSGATKPARGARAAATPPLTGADVEKYLEVQPDFAKAKDMGAWTTIAAAHGMTVTDLLALTGRVSAAYMNLSIKGGVGKATGRAAEDMEVVRPYADRIREATARPK